MVKKLSDIIEHCIDKDSVALAETFDELIGPKVLEVIAEKRAEIAGDLYKEDVIEEEEDLTEEDIEEILNSLTEEELAELEAMIVAEEEEGNDDEEVIEEKKKHKLSKGDMAAIDKEAKEAAEAVIKHKKK